MDFQEEAKRLQGLIAAEKRTGKKIHADLGAIHKEQADAEAVQRDCAYPASTEKDEAVAKRLEEAELTLSRIAQRVRSKEIALEVSQKKIVELENQLSAVLRETKSQEYAVEAKALVTADAGELEKCFVTLKSVMTRIEGRVKKMDQLSLEGAFEPAHRNVLKNLRHASAQRLNVGPAYMEKRFRNFFRSSIPEIFAQTMSGAAQSEETKEEKQTA